jgi:TetR/AcrR family transcriptional regulator, fatty acid metabolism regulator protein
MRKEGDSSRKEKEEVIFEAALKVIKEKGFHKARMSDIARQAGSSYGLVYHYFNGKENLFDAIIERWWNGLFGLMAHIEEGPSGVYEKLRGIVAYFLDTYQAHPELVNIFITEISRSTANLTSQRLNAFKKFMALTEAVITEGQDKDILRRDVKARYLTTIFLGSLEAFVSTMVLADEHLRGDAQKERIAGSLLEIFLHGAKARNERKGETEKTP